MNILAIDIGGTHSRFAHIEAESFDQINRIPTQQIATQSEHTHSLQDLLDYFLANKTDSFYDLSEYKTIALSVPGPVYDEICLPPNIPWPIDVSLLKKSHKVFMLNDFSAQAYGCLVDAVRSEMDIIHNAGMSKDNISAVIGAGTGIGHALLLKHKQQYSVVSSEAGHATFSFMGDEEKAFEQFVLKRLHVNYCVNDHIVNGRGICLLHEFLSAEKCTAAQIFSNPERNAHTLDLFVRFYARLARNYCLSNCIDNQLIISGGLAAKNPALLQRAEFSAEFSNLTTESYRPLLDKINIYLNKRDDVGLIGAAKYACLIHTARPRGRPHGRN